MVARLKPLLSFETTWIQGYARTYLLSDASLSFPAEALRLAKVNLLDVRNVFRFGRVVYANKLNAPGALWIVEGEDCNCSFLEVTTVVVSEEYRVTIRAVRR